MAGVGSRCHRPVRSSVYRMRSCANARKFCPAANSCSAPGPLNEAVGSGVSHRASSAAGRCLSECDAPLPTAGADQNDKFDERARELYSDPIPSHGRSPRSAPLTQNAETSLVPLRHRQSPVKPDRCTQCHQGGHAWWYASPSEFGRRPVFERMRRTAAHDRSPDLVPPQQATRRKPDLARALTPLIRTATKPTQPVFCSPCAMPLTLASSASNNASSS